MGRRYLIVSDLHLTDTEDHPDGWKAYKHSRWVFDGEFAALLERYSTCDADEGVVTLVFNGDLFDFDLVTAVPESPPWPVSRSERRRGLDATEEKSVWKLTRILEHHPRFLEALANFCAEGHKVVYVMGNHDREFHFASVRAAFTRALEAAAVTQGKTLPPDPIRYEPWFYYVPGELYAEHGQQYDYYSSYQYILAPTVRSRRGVTLALPMGNLSGRYLTTRMGFFNPHSGDFILNVFSYLGHWFKHYAFSRRSLLFTWLIGSLVVMRKLVRQKRLMLSHPPNHGILLEELAGRYGLASEKVKAIDSLRKPPITDRVYRMMREFWIDRVIIAAIMIGGTVALALVPIPLWIKLMVPLSGFPLLFFLYEEVARGETIFAVEKRLPEVARRIAELLQVPLVTFGHTHIPRLIPLSRGVSFVDTGTWGPMFRKGSRTELVPGCRNYLFASFDGEGGVTILFDSLMA